MSESASPEIGILFVDRDISLLFSELLASRGVPSKTLTDSNKLGLYKQVITESCYLDQLSPEQQERSLLVGNRETALEGGIHQLIRPLTEEKIESALKYLLQITTY